MYADLGTRTRLVPNDQDQVSTAAIAVATAKYNDQEQILNSP